MATQKFDTKKQAGIACRKSREEHKAQNTREKGTTVYSLKMNIRRLQRKRVMYGKSGMLSHATRDPEVK
jgi:hypothetical protein